MTPAERLEAAIDAFESMNIPSSDPNYVCLNTLIAIGQLLLNIDTRQTQGATT
ncbi:hypothetical protein [Mycolicibacterium fortuitum]|uniref:hypothetical protein n=1 Tax=Mycolicibacterium fortuitum TaxID=1766 RepID=UPI000A7BD9AC|nr:hypothetical protein [Mycolicibacterium fortuitum]